MFFKTKRNPRKTTRQTLSTEQLEPKAMFNAAPLQVEIGFEDRLSNDYDRNDAVLQIRSSQNVTCNTGFSGGGNYICNADSIWTTGGASTLRIGTNSGPGGTTFMTGEDGVSIIHPSYHDGEGCRGIIDPEDNISGSAGPGGTSYISETDGHSIVHPQFNVGIDGLAQANQQPHLTAIRDVDVASESLGGSADPGGDDIFMPKPNRTDVLTNGSATSLAPRHAAFAMMGR